MKIFRRSLIGFLIAVVILFVGFFLASIFTYPNGSKAAITNLDDATGLLFYKMAGSEAQVSNMEEKIAGEANWQPKPGELDELWPNQDFPYSAQLPSDAQGKIEIIYNWEVSGSTLTLKCKTNNIGNVKSMELRDLYVSIAYKDVNGSEIEPPSVNMLGNFGVWMSWNENNKEPRLSTAQYDNLPEDFLNRLANIELIVY